MRKRLKGASPLEIYSVSDLDGAPPRTNMFWATYFWRLGCTPEAVALLDRDLYSTPQLLFMPLAMGRIDLIEDLIGELRSPEVAARAKDALHIAQHPQEASARLSAALAEQKALHSDTADRSNVIRALTFTRAVLEEQPLPPMPSGADVTSEREHLDLLITWQKTLFWLKISGQCSGTEALTQDLLLALSTRITQWFRIELEAVELACQMGVLGTE